jgi:hypothetical protein
MSRKTLLTESEVRRFLKLANMSSVGDKRIQEVSMYDDDEAADDVKGKQKDEWGQLDEEEADPEALEDYAAGDLERGEPGEAETDELEADAELDAELGDEMGDEDLGAGGGDGQTVAVDDFMSALEDALEDVLGEPVGVDMDAGEEEVEDVEMDAEMEMGDEGGEEEMSMDAVMGGGEEEEELPGMRNMYESTDDIVNEVVRRVASRIVKEKKQDDMAAQLAERIFNRLTK